MISLSPKDSGIEMPEGEPRVSEEEATRAKASAVVCEYAAPKLKGMPYAYFEAWRDDFLDALKGQMDMTYLLMETSGSNDT